MYSIIGLNLVVFEDGLEALIDLSLLGICSRVVIASLTYLKKVCEQRSISAGGGHECGLGVKSGSGSSAINYSIFSATHAMTNSESPLLHTTLSNILSHTILASDLCATRLKCRGPCFEFKTT